MTVFLEKVRQKTLFSAFEPIITEPLELIYLQTVLSQENIPSYIIDPLFEMKAPESEVPELIILSGYNVAENLIIKTARRWRKTFPSARIMVSGVHAQLNREVFQDEAIDYIFFSQSLETYRGFIRSFMRGEAFHRGVDVFYIESDASGREKGIWIPGEQDILEKEESIIPDRKFFESVKNRTRYIDKKSLALVKGGSGCPYGCSFCYCRLLNSGRYLRPDYEKLMEEINAIDSEHIWIIDDSFLITREDALDFIRASRKYSHNYGAGNACTTGSAGTTGSAKSLIAYLRADFVVENEDLIPELKKCGLREIITGFESPDADTLKSYNKGQSSGIYQKLTEILKREESFPTGIDLGYMQVAMPHVEAKHVNDNAMFVVTTKKGVEFENAEDDGIVNSKIIFGLIVKDSEKHLDFLMKLVELYQKEDVLKKIYDSNDVEEVMTILKQNLI